MDNLVSAFKAAKQNYDKNRASLKECFAVADICLRKINDGAELLKYGGYSGKPPVDYSVFRLNNEFSRPFRPDLMIADPDVFNERAAYITKQLQKHDLELQDYPILDSAIYTAVMSVCICFDLWQRTSRKTPGTYFEVLVGSALREYLPDCEFGKHVKIVAGRGNLVPEIENAAAEANGESEDPDIFASENSDGEFVATDIVIFNRQAQRGAIIPLKITTRERIVQPFAHQRILDSAFPGAFQSFISCISETQLDKKTQSVKQICVPGTIKLFQKHLSSVAGLYYCDIPQRYGNAAFSEVINVKTFAMLFSDVRAYLKG